MLKLESEAMDQMGLRSHGGHFVDFVGGHFQQCTVDVDRGCIPSFGASAGWDSGNLLGERPRDVCKPRDAGAPAEEKFGTSLQIGRTIEFG